MHSETLKSKFPVVFISGFLASGDFNEKCWGPVLQRVFYFSEIFLKRKINKKFKTRNCEKSILVQSGPGSSLHDRACEVFYQLVSGVVDYGANHSSHFRHKRFKQFLEKK